MGEKASWMGATLAALVIAAVGVARTPARPVTAPQETEITCGNTTRPAIFVPSGATLTVTVRAGDDARVLRLAACAPEREVVDLLSFAIEGLEAPLAPVSSTARWTTQSSTISPAGQASAALSVRIRSQRLYAAAPLDRRGGVYVALGVLREATPAHPSVILISIDTLRADRLRTYGYSLPTDPNIASFASTGTVFTQAIAQAPSTPPSHAALLTGHYPARTGLFVSEDVSSAAEKPGYRLRANLPTLAAALRAQGYYTRAMTGGGFVSHQFGFARGFDVFSEERSALPGELMRSGAAAIGWLDENADRRFFLFLHTYEVHVGPYDYQHEYFRLQDEHKGLYASYGDGDASYRNARYDSGVQFTDESIGQILRFLAAKRQLDKIVVVITSDHGETMAERRAQSGYAFNHGFTLYDELLRVPLVMGGPGIPSGARIDAQVESIDIMPTLLELAGAPATRGDGASLVATLHGGRPVKSYAYSESVAGGPYRSAIRMGGFKYIRVLSWALTSATPMKMPPPEELYDLRKDPGERTNVVSQPAYQLTLERMRTAFDRAEAAAGTRQAIPAAARTRTGQ
jgi:arylsulfatase A-like enzyme